MGEVGNRLGIGSLGKGKQTQDVFVPDPTSAHWRRRLYEIIFEADTPAGKIFDVGLLVMICLSVLAVALESVAAIRTEFGVWLRGFDWAVTILFSLEYGLRLMCVRRPWRYATSFFGVVDLLAILPVYLSIFFVGTQSLTVIRAVRLLRIFRILKLAQFVGEAQLLRTALHASRRKIAVFLGAVMTSVLIVGATMYLVEGPRHGFTSIPQSMYWAIVTMTTVGYGDIAPHTPFGKLCASVVMLMGYGILAVPTGIVTVELASLTKTVTTRFCDSCTTEGHDLDATYCKYCGVSLALTRPAQDLKS